MDYTIPTLKGGLYNKSVPMIKKPLTLAFTDDESGIEQRGREDNLAEEKSTERVRKYYKRHPEKVRAYLKKTQDDRVARNRDRRKAVEKHGKAKMKNHDVHHPNGPQNGGARLAKKDHGRDKVKEHFDLTEQTDVLHHMYNFVDYACTRMNLNKIPTIKVIAPQEGITSLGHYNPATTTIGVVTQDRLLADILRTLAHEIVHHRQTELGKLKDVAQDGMTGSPIENQANVLAGILLRDYGKQNRHIFLMAENIFKNTILCRKCLWRWPIAEAGEDKYVCHRCWHDNTPQYLTEGGAHGHLAHPFEDTDLSFDDFDEMLTRALVGNLEQEGPVVEKMDGQNIAFTIRDGRVVFARNKGHLKNRAEKALSADELAQMFAGRGEVGDAFRLAAQDIEAAMAGLSPEQIEEIFSDGRRVMSTEIIYPGTRNVIPYDKTVLVFHGTLEHDDEGEKVGVQNTEHGKSISDAVTRANAQAQRTFGISGPRTVAISDQVTEELQSVHQSLTRRLEDVRNQFGLKPNATLRDYLDAWWNERLSQVEQERGIKFTNAEREGLVARWVDGDKKFGVKGLSDDKKDWFKEFEKTELKSEQKRATRPFEQVFLTAGVHSLRRVVEFLSANNPAMAEQLKSEFAKTVREIREAGGEIKLERLEFELARLKELGVDELVPSEGLIFTYNGNPYKLTGAFAPVNQIMGTLKYNRNPEPPKEEQPKEDTPKVKSSLEDVVSDLEFKPTTKQPKQYKPAEDITDASDLGKMTPMTFARNTVPGLRVVTITADGKETENTANEGDVIMSGPSGEQYVIKGPKFDKLYTENPDGTRIPEQSPRQVSKYEGTEEITFTAPWGESMILKPGDYLVKDGDGYYRIAKTEYEQTYNPPGQTGSEPPKTAEEPTTPTEEPLPEPRTPVAIYPGRFQPFHAGHYEAYQALVEKFGKDNVYVVTSDVQDSVKSPFSFKEKQEIMMRMFGIPEDRIVQVKKPYTPVELTEKLPEGTPLVFGLGEKDAERLGSGKYFQPFDEEGEMAGFRDVGYVFVVPPPSIELDGKKISGTQLREMLGNPQITDRAKQEIFTKLYGKFDQDIFDKVVKVTTKSEEARALTDMHGKPKEEKPSSKQRKKKSPEEKDIGVARSVLTQKVRNPKTNRDILVATALTYEEDEPVRKAAEELMQKAMKGESEPKTEIILTEVKKKSENLKVYVYTRDYTEEELEYEIDEYFENERTLEAFPDLADSAYELKEMIDKAPAEVLNVEQLLELQNSDASDILSGKNKQQILKKLIDNKKDVTGLLKDIKAKKPIAMPVVIRHVSGYYLLGGNTRLSVLASLGLTMPVKVLAREAPLDYPISVYPAKDATGEEKKPGYAKGLFNSLLKKRIINPETGNEIKIDTAMDYKKTHPAHRAAMSVIRQNMRGLSNRAGIPKNRKK